MRFLLICIVTTVFSTLLSSQQSPGSIDRARWMGMTLQSGVRFKDHKALSELLYNDENALPPGIYYNGAVEARFAFDRIYAVVGIQPASFEKEINKTDRLEIRDAYGYFSIGYMLKPATRWEVLPQIGLTFGESDISLTRDSMAATSVRKHLSDPPDTYTFTMSRAYGRAAVTATYRLYWPEATLAKGFFPVEIGLNAEYQQAISASRWENGLRKKMDGPDVFANSFYVGFVAGWWL